MAVIVYNGYTLPDQFSKFSYQNNYPTASFSCQFILTAATEAALVTACNSAESSLREWNRDFTMSFGGSAEYSFGHSSNTGFLAQPSLSIIANRLQTGTSRAYKFSVSFSLPADQLGYNYRQSGNINLSQDIKGRLMLSISGKYTAGGSNSAYDNFIAHGETWANSIASGLGTFEKMSENSSHEQEDKVLTFSFRYQQKLNLTIKYNSYTIPGSYNNFSFSETYTTLSMSFDFAIAHTSAALAEGPLRIFNEDLTISFNGSAVYSYKHSANTGLITKPTLRKISNTTQDDTLRFYNFSITCQLPSDKAGYGYRRDGNISTSYGSERRRTISFTGVYTAGGVNSALQNYTANAKTWANLFLTAFGGTYELVAESPKFEQENKIVNFNLTYRELLTNDSKTNLNEEKILEANCNYRVNIAQKVGISIDYNQVPLTTISVNYSAKIDKVLVPTDTDIEATYRSVVRPWIVEHSYLVLGMGSYAQSGTDFVIESESYSINPHTYQVSGSLSFTALQDLFQIIELSERINITRNYGITTQKIWDGKPFTYNIYAVGQEQRMRRSISIVKVSEIAHLPSDIGGGYVKKTQSEDNRVQEIGVGSVGTLAGESISVKLYTSTYLQDYIYIADSVSADPTAGGFHDPRA